MKLIDNESLVIEEFMGTETLKYAILSHTWEANEATFQDFSTSEREAILTTAKFRKIAKTCSIAKEEGYKYTWIDTCCIDKTSSAELSEAINSMFRWYQNAAVCYAWLADLDPDDGSGDDMFPQLAKCRWFRRGWTLQELLAPRDVRFYDKDWHLRGTKLGLSNLISRVAGISESVLNHPEQLQHFPIAQRMSWAANRETSRVEDLAYSLLGVFDVNMPMLYGEGSRAFLRLQSEIAKESNDLSLFAWTRPMDQAHSGIFAQHPSDFANSGSISLSSDPVFTPEFSTTNKGLRIFIEIIPGPSGQHLMKLSCARGKDTSSEEVGIWIQQHGGGVWGRVRAHELGAVTDGHLAKQTALLLLQRVTPQRSLELEGGQSLVFQFRKNFNDEERREFSDFPFLMKMMSPQGEWDAQRRMILTHGAPEFIGYAYFFIDAESSDLDLMTGQSFLVVFGVDVGNPEPWVTVGTPFESAGLFSVMADAKKLAALVKARGDIRSVLMKDKGFKDKYPLSVSLEMMPSDGKEVCCIDIDLSMYAKAEDVETNLLWDE